MGKTEIINVFNYLIHIKTDSAITKIEKYNDELVILIIENQFGDIIKIPIKTIENYRVSADEFIGKFEKEIKKLHKKEIKKRAKMQINILK
jgi:hypothetical protein